MKIFGEKHWKKLKESKRASKPFRTVLDVILMLTTDVFIALSLQIQSYRWIYIVMAALSLFSELFVMVYYLLFDEYISMMKKNEMDQAKKMVETYKSKNEELSRRIGGYEETLNAIQAISEVTAGNINAFYHKLIANDRTVEETVWSYKQTCVLVCRDVHSILSKLYQCDKDIEVTYIAFDKGSTEDHCRMIAYEPKNRESPSLYSCDKVIPKRVKKKSLKKYYCFERLYLENTNAPLILWDEESIKKNFFFSSIEERDKCKYKQYIAIPICCKKNDIIGVLQIATFRNNIIKREANMISQFLTAILRPIAYLTLLAQKMQRCIDVVSEEQKYHESAQ